MKNDVYTFTVTVSNAAGPNSSVLSDVRGKLSVYYIFSTVTALSIDDSTVKTRGCLTVNRGAACSESASSDNLAVMLVYGVGTCETVDNTTPVNQTINDGGACVHPCWN